MNSREKPVFFFGDAHLGAGSENDERRKLDKIATLMEKVIAERAKCFILGDLFDFWFEFRGGIPRGFDEILQILRRGTDSGAEIYLIGGNHDWWAGEKLEKFTGIRVYRKPFIGEIGGVHVFAGHGDGLAVSDWGYRKLLCPIFRNPVNRWFFKNCPRSIGQRLMSVVSSGSKLYTQQRNLDLEMEYVVAAQEIIREKHVEYVLIGHTHEPARIVQLKGGEYINIGNFFEQFSYAVLHRGKIELKNI